MFKKIFNDILLSTCVLTLGLSLGFTSLQGGEIEDNFVSMDDPHGELFDPELLPEEICVAIVLGGCASRGIGYAGVFEVFEKAGIPIDLIVGASAGSIVGSVYADVPDVEYLKDVFFNMKTSDMYHENWYLWNQRYGYTDGSQMRRTMERLLTVENLEDLKIPFIATATDLRSGELISYNKGSIAYAVQGSSAYPPLFSPVEYGGRTLIDSGISSPLPTHIARDVGAQVVIAVDFSLPLTRSQPSHIAGVMARCYEISYLRLIRAAAKEADIYMRLDLPQDMGEQIEFANNPFLHESYIAGKEAAQRALPEILKLLKEKGIM